VPHKRCRMLYYFHELDNVAKQTARDEWCEKLPRSEWWDCTFDDFIQIASILGVEIDGGSRRNIEGEILISEPSIFFSGFYHQGSGACFAGHYAYAKGWREKLLSHAPQDKELLDIGQQLQEAQNGFFYRVTAEIKHIGCDNSMQITAYNGDYHVCEIIDGGEITSALRALASWLYNSLQEEYEYLTSNEAVTADIENCEGEFTQDGHIDR